VPSYLLLENGDRLLLESGDGILLEGDGEAPVGYQAIVWREWRNFISHRDGGPTLGKLEYSQHAEDPQPGVWWTTRANALIDYTGYTFTLKIHNSTTTVLTKTTGITGAAGSGTPPTGTPNIAIQWAVDELLNIPAGEYTMELTPRTGGRDRDPISMPIRIKASAP
jgi:hypothetical protein